MFTEVRREVKSRRKGQRLAQSAHSLASPAQLFFFFGGRRKKSGLVALLEHQLSVSPARAAIAACQSACSIQSREVVLMLARHTHDLFQLELWRSNQVELCLKS